MHNRNKEYLNTLKKIYQKKGTDGLIKYLDDNDISEPHSFEEIGYVMGVSRERIRQIEASAIAKLRHPRFGGSKFRDMLKDYIYDLNYKPEIVSYEDLE